MCLYIYTYIHTYIHTYLHTRDTELKAAYYNLITLEHVLVRTTSGFSMKQTKLAFI